jgi:hypothetical protein
MMTENDKRAIKDLIAQMRRELYSKKKIVKKTSIQVKNKVVLKKRVKKK